MLGEIVLEPKLSVEFSAFGGQIWCQIGAVKFNSRASRQKTFGGVYSIFLLLLRFTVQILQRFDSKLLKPFVMIGRDRPFT